MFCDRSAPSVGPINGSLAAKRERRWVWLRLVWCLNLFSWSPSEDRIGRFDDREEAEAELARVRSYTANGSGAYRLQPSAR
jgi:hypothetical protein